MAFEFRLPDLGEGIAEGELVKWLAKEGDAVEEHKELLEVETDKALVKVPSPKSGIILKINAAAGSTVSVGEVLCIIGEKGEKVATAATGAPLVAKSAKETAAPAKPPARKKGSSTVIGELEEAPDEEETPTQQPTVTPSSAKIAGVLALPAVRKLAEEMGADLSTIKGTGDGGRITEDDVRAASGKEAKASATTASKAPTIGYEKFGRVLRVPLKGIRKAIAENMVTSVRTIPHVTHMDYVDVTKLAAYREQEKEAAEGKGVKLTYLPFIVKACVLALKEFPYLNSSMDDETGEIVIKQYYNIGIAVDTPQGLMVPIVKSPQEKTIIEIGRDIYRVAELARTRDIEMKDLQGGTFTITNIGSIGGVFATPIINHPECAILGLGRILDMAVPLKGKFEIRKMLPISLTFDHRIVDGATAARFANEIKRRLEEPDSLFMGY